MPGASAADPVIIGALPYEDCADPGIDFASRWYKYVPPADQVVSAYPCPTVPATGANVNLWTGTDPGALDYQGFNASGPFMYPVKLGGDDLYFEVYVDDAAGGEVCLSVVLPTNTPIQAGDLVVSEDETHNRQNLYDPSFEGFWPYIWYAPDGTLRFVAPATLPATELGACLNTGIWAVLSKDANQLFIYDVVPGVTLLGRYALGVADGENWVSFATDFVDFYAIYAPNGADPLQVYKITAAGVVSGPIATCQFYSACNVPGAAGGNSSSGLSRDASILYYPSSTLGGGIHRHNIATDTPLADIPAPAALDFIGDVIVLSDDTIVAIAIHDSGALTSTNKLYHWAVDGTLLQTVVLSTYPWEAHHICHASDNNSDTVWAWTEWLDSASEDPANITGYSLFQLMRLATGVADQEFTKGIFIAGVGPYDDTLACGSEAFGAPSSCPLFVMMDASPPEPVPGNCPGGGMLLPPGSGGAGCPEGMALPAASGGNGCTTC